MLLVFFIVYQQIENHLLQPLVYSRTVRLSPLVILIAVLIGAQLGRRARCARRDPGRGHDAGAPDRVARTPAHAAHQPGDGLEQGFSSFSRALVLSKSLVRGEGGGHANADLKGMRTLAAVGVFLLLVLARLRTRSRSPRSLRGSNAVATFRARRPLFSARLLASSRPRPSGTASGAAESALSALELDIVARINAQRGARGLRPLRVSRGLTAAADYHSHQMGLFGFFEHESRNGAPFWRRIAALLSVGPRLLVGRREHLLGVARHERREHGGRMDGEPASPSEHPYARVARGRHRGRSLRRCDGPFGGRPVTIVTADFGVRR